MTSAGSDAGTGQAGRDGQRTAPGRPVDAGTGLADQGGATAVSPADAGCGGAPDRERVNSVPAAGQTADGRPSDGRPDAAQPVLSEPVLSEPVLSGPVLSGPVLSGPVLSEPVLSGPVLSGPVLSEQSREDTDVAWGDYRGRDDEDSDRLYRDRPPHWADY